MTKDQKVKTTINFFEFFEIRISYLIDSAELRKKFISKSKQYHPDFYTLKSVEEQEEAMRLSTLNNDAYNTLKDLDKRIKYILEQQGAMPEEGQAQIPQDFLMEMMEYNEQLMEIAFDPDPLKSAELKGKITDIAESLLSTIDQTTASNDMSPAGLEIVRNYFFKKRYINRLLEKLEG